MIPETWQHFCRACGYLPLVSLNRETAITFEKILFKCNAASHFEHIQIFMSIAMFFET
jgi:hypothetical protein